MFTGGQISYAYQMGTNPECLADSPGWLVVCASLVAGIEQHESGLDLLRGDESYKSRMGGVPQSMLQVRVVPAQLGSPIAAHGVADRCHSQELDQEWPSRRGIADQ